VSEPSTSETGFDVRDHALHMSNATGNPLVDQVLASFDGLGDLPVADHVVLFESAHARLRSALADTDVAAHGGVATPDE
jgi:hypothetical protein